ncbi:hypothetical protein A2774_00565 [Candidatus Roizmanbacteria bacterium RIFCSPHIGHO2_01_FULL_39_12c]|uniref:Uncharacterized protein n=1 Tax=Candidatus Roizmanbacteria bacterium RIFCSPHIGHO2_01_FULL_39_12c TaxID=1802031 RepID=A0A1F7G9W0_9BACT|nr:MAG: hypothetical protein A2774_00565 [Candidatus Roizmanbacteria bacterium RIFCSPHIGHO2_01_FULL_39_12c]OGK47363.1 MAG: hypothetical protein A2963_04485 [Candidatus Roizmanbacteria bacterium RIFCSPLOWO2_01_FULL_40_13]
MHSVYQDLVRSILVIFYHFGKWFIGLVSLGSNVVFRAWVGGARTIIPNEERKNKDRARTYEEACQVQI